MRHTEKCEKAMAALLKATREYPVQITYRGLQDDGASLYEVKHALMFDMICPLGTEAQILDALIARADRGIIGVLPLEQSK